MSTVPRLRLFAGPNGSGKSTIKSVLPKELLGVYINPDEIEQDIRRLSYFEPSAFGVTTPREEMMSFFAGSMLLAKGTF